MAWGEKPYITRLMLYGGLTQTVPLALNKAASNAAHRPYVDNIIFGAPISPLATNQAKPIVAKNAYVSRGTTSSGKAI